jgi:PP-loop superfamily ATP-utilizing enzyme
MKTLPLHARTCTRCLCYEDMTWFLHPHTLPKALRAVTIAADGVCSVCHAYLASVDESELRKEADYFASQCSGPVIVLFSGGKDSLATLVAAKQRLNLDVIALLYDNGLIPDEVIAKGRALCARLDVPLHVHKDVYLPDGDGRTFLDVASAIVATDRTPCIACGKNLYRAAAELALANQSEWLIQGTHYFAQWNKRPGSFRVFPSHGHMMKVIHLPYAIGLTNDDVKKTLADLDVVPADVPGVSTNCLLPARVQVRVSDDLGHVPELEDLAFEVMVGHVTREDAIRELQRKSG